MLNPANDRLNYGELLSPPAGFRLDFAVGTTYSLDLNALAGAAVSLGLSEETDSTLMKNPICMLEALRIIGDKTALFCEAGQIRLSGNGKGLHILLEKAVFPVVTAKKNGISKYPSFHPKFWLIRYVDDKNKSLYRALVLSRNLTFDNSWDVAFCMEGQKTSEKTDKNNPVSDFLSYLVNQLPENDNAHEKGKKMLSISKELKHICFETGSKEFYDYEFIPVGIPRHTMENDPLFKDPFDELFIMSPFLSSGIIRDFNERSKSSDCVLITRAAELGKLKSGDSSNFKIYTVKDAVIDGERMISEETDAADSHEDTDDRGRDIHAKVYMTRKYSNSRLYLGSLNASHNALHGNIEFMIALYSKNRYLNLSKLRDSLFGNDEAKNPFREAVLPDTPTDEDEAHDLDMYIKAINRLSPVAIVTENGGLYDVCVTFPSAVADHNIRISPLLSDDPKALAENICFTSLELTKLSEFYRITACDGGKKVSRIIMIPTENMPEDRERAVISKVIENTDSFYRYIALLLGDSFALSAMENAEGTAGSHSGQSLRGFDIPELYEKMLRAADTCPEKFKDIDNLIKSVSNDGVIPEEFEKLCNTFKKAVKL